MNDIKCNFFGCFKLGKNIVFNTKTLNLLYSLLDEVDESEKKLIRKPIILLIGSIVEALLYDFIEVRIGTYTSEGVSRVKQNTLKKIRKKTYDQFETYIAAIKKYRLLTGSNQLFDDLHLLRMLRNRIHIQNRDNNFHIYDEHAFTENRLSMAENILEFCLKTLEKHHSRAKQYHLKEENIISLPWKPHYKSDEI